MGWGMRAMNNENKLKKIKWQNKESNNENQSCEVGVPPLQYEIYIT